MSLEDVFGEAIYSYTRKQAIEDGVLVDVTEASKEAGFKFPIAISRAAYEKYVEWTDEDTERHSAYQDVSGRLWDVLWMLHVAIKGGPNKVSESGDAINGVTVQYNFLCVPRDMSHHSEPVEYTLKAVCGPGDDMAPVITIMLPEED
jgi:hypothetical protein